MNAESFAIFTSCMLIAGVGTVYWVQQFASIHQCSTLSWILLLPTVLYYSRIMISFSEHEKAFNCEPPASIQSCLMSICGCLLLQAVALLHTRTTHYELETLRWTITLHSVFRIITTAIAWTSFAATIGHVESEKLAYVGQNNHKNRLNIQGKLNLEV